MPFDFGDQGVGCHRVPQASCVLFAQLSGAPASWAPRGTVALPFGPVAGLAETRCVARYSRLLRLQILEQTLDVSRPMVVLSEGLRILRRRQAERLLVRNHVAETAQREPQGLQSLM